jgi:hypothetical protein
VTNKKEAPSAKKDPCRGLLLLKERTERTLAAHTNRSLVVAPTVILQALLPPLLWLLQPLLMLPLLRWPLLLRARVVGATEMVRPAAVVRLGLRRNWCLKRRVRWGGATACLMQMGVHHLL